MSTSRFSAILGISILLLAGCRPTVVTEENASSFDHVVARADNSLQITMSELYDIMGRSSFAPNGGVVGVDKVSEFLDSILVDTLAGFAADDIALDEYYDSYRLFRQRYVDAMIDGYFKVAVYDKVTADSLEVVEFYNSHPEMFNIAEHVFVYHILISPRGLKNGPDSLKYIDYSKDELDRAAEEMAREIRSTVTSLESFQAAAKEYSHDTVSGRSGGVVGWTPRGVYLDPFDSVAFALQPGEVSEPYEDLYGWHMLFCEQRKEAGVAPFDANVYMVAEQNLRTDKANKLGRALVDSVFSDIQVEYNEDILDSNLFLTDEQVWVAVVNGKDTIDCGVARGPEINLRNRGGVANTTPEQKKQMLTDLTHRFALLEAARQLKVDTLPALVKERKSLYHKYAKIIVLRRMSESGWLPSEEAIEKYYEENAKQFQVEKPLVVQHIIVQDSLFGDFLRDQAMSGVEFMDLAKEFYPGDEDVKMELADLGAIGPEDVPEEFWRAAQMTIPGEVSYPVKTKYGYHIIKVLENRKSLTVDLARPQIVNALKERHTREVFQSFRDDLYARFHVEFPGKLEAVNLKPISLRG